MRTSGRKRLVWTLLSLSLALESFAALSMAGEPPANQPGGSYAGKATAMDKAMLNGTAEDVTRVISEGKERLGEWVGCPDEGPSTNPVIITWRTPNFTAPTLSAVRSRWNSHASTIANYNKTSLSGDEAFTALGGYYALMASEPLSTAVLSRMARNVPVSSIVNASAGGPEYDYGKHGIMLAHAAALTTDWALKAEHASAARTVADWCARIPPYHNHNYTSKAVWALANAYAWSGDTKYRTALLDKLERNLKPCLLMDFDRDGKVDGMADQPFSGLWRGAQLPGRPWDGHNSRPEYAGMIGYALVDAYAALRDRGDTAEAAKLKPYTVAILDNLSREIEVLGMPNKGITRFPLALAQGIWKIAQAENEPHPKWERAAYAAWNAGAGDSAWQAGSYLLFMTPTPYKSLAENPVPETTAPSGPVSWRVPKRAPRTRWRRHS